MADAGFNFQQCLLFSKFHNLKISLFPKHPCMHRSKIIDLDLLYTGLKWNRIHYLIQNGRSKMADGSNSPSFFNNKWRHHDITAIVKEYMLYVSQLNNSIRHLTVEVFWVLVYLHWYMFKSKAHVERETCVMWKARLQPSCESLAPRTLSALCKTLKIALVLQATKNFHNNWRSGLLGRRELPKKKNKQTNKWPQCKNNTNNHFGCSFYCGDHVHFHKSIYLLQVVCNCAGYSSELLNPISDQTYIFHTHF